MTLIHWSLPEAQICEYEVPTVSPVTMVIGSLLFVSGRGRKAITYYVPDSVVDLGTACIPNGHGTDRAAAPGQS